MADQKPSGGSAAQAAGAAAKKPKPEGFPDAEWEKMRNSALANGYFYQGWGAMQKQNWKDCDADMKSALPLVGNDQNKLGSANFALGVCNYKLGELTNDRSRKQIGQQYMEKAAGIKSGVQGQAYTQNLAMKQALAGR